MLMEMGEEFLELSALPWYDVGLKMSICRLGLGLLYANIESSQISDTFHINTAY